MQIKTKIRFHTQHSGKREKSARPRWRGGEISVSRVLVDVCTGTASLEKMGQYLVFEESSASCRWMPACPQALLDPVLPTTSCWGPGEKPTPGGWLQSPDLCCLWKCMCPHVCTYMQVYARAQHMWLCFCMCVHVHMHVRTHACTHVHICMYM